MDVGLHSVYSAVPNQQSLHHCLADVQIRLPLQHSLHPSPVPIPIILRPGALHGQPLSRVQAPELDPCLIGVLGHLPAQGVNLFDKMALGQSADGRITAHGCDVIQVDGEEEGRVTHASRCQGRLTSRMARPHHDHIVCRWMSGHDFSMSRAGEACGDAE